MSAVPVPRSRPAAVQWFRDVAIITQRSLIHIRRVPERLLDVTIQPIIFVLLFSYVFGGAIGSVTGFGGATAYHAYLVAGMLAQNMVFTVASMATGVAADMQEGVIDRFRSLPMARSSVLFGRTVGEFAQMMIGVLVTSIVGLFVGWRITTGVMHGIEGFLLLGFFAFCWGWAGTVVGMIVRGPEAAQGLAFLVLFPVSFASAVFVPTGTLPSWLATFANWNPVSALAVAARNLFGDPGPPVPNVWPLQHPVVTSLLWAVGILIVFAPISIAMFNRRVNR